MKTLVAALATGAIGLGAVVLGVAAPSDVASVPVAGDWDADDKSAESIANLNRAIDPEGWHKTVGGENDTYDNDSEGK